MSVLVICAMTTPMVAEASAGLTRVIGEGSRARLQEKSIKDVK